MAEERPQNIALTPIPYATPRKGPPRGWVPCIVGLFVWGTLSLFLIPIVIAVVIYFAVRDGAMPTGSEVSWEGALIGILLLTGLSPLSTARRMMRSEFRLVHLTIVVTALPSIFGLVYALFALLPALPSYDDWWFGLIGALLAIFFVGMIWVAARLESIATLARNPSLNEDLKSSAENPHAKP